jgi:hypothetical protein
VRTVWRGTADGSLLLNIHDLATFTERPRRREQLLHSLKNPHPEAAELAEAGVAEWGASLPSGDDELVDVQAGKAVRWVEGQGWVEESA